jgi:hypothetical protein
MATTKIDSHDLETAPAGADLSEKQFFLVKLNEEGKLVLAGAGDPGYALQDNPKQGVHGTYAVFGRTKAVAGGNIKAGALVSADANGKLVEATTTELEAEKVKRQGSLVIGRACETGGVAGDLVAYRQIVPAGRA